MMSIETAIFVCSNVHLASILSQHLFDSLEYLTVTLWGKPTTNNENCLKEKLLRAAVQSVAVHLGP